MRFCKLQIHSFTLSEINYSYFGQHYLIWSARWLSNRQMISFLHVHIEFGPIFLLMPYLFTGEFTFLYTLTICRDVLAKSAPGRSLIIFCLTLIGVYFLKRLIDYQVTEKDRSWYKVIIGHLIFNSIAPLCKIFCTDTFLLFAAIFFFSTFYTLIRDPAKQFEWDNKTIKYFEGIQGFLAVLQFFFLHVSVIYECDRRSNMYIMNQIFLSVLWAFSSFYLCAILMRKLKVKESVERPDETENPVVDEDRVLPAEDASQGD